MKVFEVLRNYDARYFQIFALSVLSAIQIFSSDFGTSIHILLISLCSMVCVHIGLSFILKTGHYDVRSSIITGFSLSLLLRSNEIWIYPVAAFLSIMGKVYVQRKGRHIFNPAALPLVLLLVLLPHIVWVSPGQWGSAGWFLGVSVCLAALVLSRSKSMDIALFFLLSWAALIFGRGIWLGDPMAIPLHQMQSGALVVFSFFMISDPATSPQTRWGRLIFAMMVALIGFIMQFEYRIREGLFYALIAMNFIVPLCYELKERISKEKVT